MAGSLDEYRRKRHFQRTPEPAGDRATEGEPSGGRFVVQKHAARRLHYDFRLEVDGALKSWAVPKGPSLSPTDKRLAVMTEDHPLDYADFEGVIPKGNYGAGTVIVWDNGTYFTEGALPVREQLERGEVKFALNGKKLRGSFTLVKMKPRGRSSTAGANEWLLIKHRDGHCDPNWNIDLHDGSVLTGGDSGTSIAAPGILEGARATTMPDQTDLMLATSIEKPFDDPDWIFELKWDGMRAAARISGLRLELRSRTGRNVTSQFPELATLPQRLRVREAIVDGEIVVLDAQGRGDFERLQSRMHAARPSRALLESQPVDYYIFDILYCNGYDLRAAPLGERKRLLRQILDPQPPFRYSDHVNGRGRDLFEQAARHGAEGIVGKQIHSAYAGGRSPLWVKLKITREVDAVVGGFTAPRGAREHFGALLVGLYDGAALRYVGGVGSGFSGETQQNTWEHLAKLEVRRCPFRVEPDTREAARWIDPKLVVRIRFAEWTREGRLRAPVFLGLRSDLDPADCILSTELPAKGVAPQDSAPVTENRLPAVSHLKEKLFHGRSETALLEIDRKRVPLSNLNKIYFPKSQYTKRHLLEYYYRVAAYILPFLRNRPLVLHRHPNGIGGQAFYQKEAGLEKPEWMTSFPILSEGRRKEIHYCVANDLAALLFLTNLGCIEHNPWSSRIDDLNHPDYVFFDLDPTEGTAYDTVVEVARAIFDLMARIGCKTFLKTSGASGFHIYLPLERVHTYEQTRTFAEILARLIAARMPGLVTLERSPGKRAAGMIYFDYSQNAYGRPLASVYSVRPAPQATVSAPVAPGELKRSFSPTRFTIKTIPARLEKSGDLWAGFWESRQRIEPALERLKGELND